MKATYSPEDNKLRLYPSERLSQEDYKRFKDAGFKWAPKQELFVAPMWTPGRFDLLLEFCGEVEDEDQSLVERAEQRADRFETYSEKRAADANAAHEAVKNITDHIPMGQPILVGHHSERRARKDAERIENGMRKAVNMWETSKYWEYRAAGAIRAAKYKERPDVRARRIKKLGAEMRKHERNKKDSAQCIVLWSAENLTQEKAETIANYKDSYAWGLWSDLRDKKITPQEAKEKRIAAHENTIKYSLRWIEHYQNRIAYETAMLEQQGATDLLKPKPKKKHAPICNYDGEVTLAGMYGNEPQTLKMHHMTKAEYAAINKDYKGCRYAADKSHRVRIALIRTEKSTTYAPVFLTDSKVHEIPEPPEPEEKKAAPLPVEGKPYQPPERTVFDGLQDQLKEGVKVVSAPQLFVTPAPLAETMVDLADINEESRVLEPSAGTGVIVEAIGKTKADIVAVEINSDLVSMLLHKASGLHIHQGDFLECNGALGSFDAVIMNPPFANAQDIAHITHALTMLNAGGRLVAICADGPRQKENLKPLAEDSGGVWEKLPAGTFKGAGTNVNTVLLSIQK